jgi:predicted amidohydrolase
MKICVAQTLPVKGDIAWNSASHQRFIALAAAQKADMIVFPELSLTGYEPSLAKELATDADDARLDVFQELSDTHQMIIGIGMPLRQSTGESISLVLFAPHQPRQVYSKYYLHADELPFFVSAPNALPLQVQDETIALAICYELSVPEHLQQSFALGANVYLASVAKTAAGVAKAHQRLAEIARTYSMTVLMSNCLGPNDDFIGAGQSAIWNAKGELLAQLDSTEEGLLVLDTETQTVTIIAT